MGHVGRSRCIGRVKVVVLPYCVRNYTLEEKLASSKQKLNYPRDQTTLKLISSKREWN